MTALIYKAALPTYTSAEALAANADENLVLNEAGTAYELEPGQGGANARWFSNAEVQASKGRFTIAANPDVPSIASATIYNVVFDTFSGPAELYENLSNTPPNNWGRMVPSIKSPGIYRVSVTNTWTSNANGMRLLSMDFFDNEDGAPAINTYSQREADAGGYPVALNEIITVWDDTKPMLLGVAIRQSSGIALAANSITVDIWKLAEFL